MTKRQAEGVQRALQRLQQAIERGETERVLRERQRICPNCREPLTDGGHFVPPSLGERGFFICQELKALEAKPMSDEGRARARRLAAGWERRFYSELWVDEIEAALTAARAEGIPPLKQSDDPEVAEACRVTPEYVLMTRAAWEAEREVRDRKLARARAEGEAVGRAAEREECARTLEWMASHPHQQADVANALKTGAGLLRIRAEAEARARAAGGGQ